MKLQHHAEWISRQSLKGKKYIEGKDYERLETFEEKIRSDRKRDTKKRDVIKKVIAYMTLGIDVSRLYPEMVKASRTEDVVMKKMIYLYLINYAE
jgi:vesicle coat complex subunit